MGKRLLKNILFFVVLIVLTFFFLMRNSDLKHVISILDTINFKWIVLGLFIMFFYILGEAVNNNLLLRKFGYKKSMLSSLKYATVGYFYSSITPSASGGQPMQLYHMSKEGVDISHGTIILLLQACSFHIITLLYMIIGVIYNGGYLIDNLHYFTILLVIGITITVCVLTILLGLLFSHKASKLFSKIAIKFIHLLHLKNEDTIVNNLKTEIDKFRESSNYLKENKKFFFNVLLVTFIQMTAFYSVSYITSLAFGVSASYFKILTLQAVLFSSISSVPLPGSMGVSEIGFGAIFTPIFSENLIRTAIMVNRFMNFYFYVFVSLIVSIIAYIRRDTYINNQNKANNLL